VATLWKLKKHNVTVIKSQADSFSSNRFDSHVEEIRMEIIIILSKHICKKVYC